jgi:hypothetical protein
MNRKNFTSTLGTRVDIVADLCEDLRQGWDPRERFSSELDQIQDRIKNSTDSEELGFWMGLQEKILKLLNGFYEEVAA